MNGANMYTHSSILGLISSVGLLRAITAYGRTEMERTQSNDCRDRQIRGHWPRAMTHVTETRHDPNTAGV